jgi:TonB family protein
MRPFAFTAVAVALLALIAGVSAQDQDKGRTRDNPVRIGGDVPPLKRLKTVAPNYPADAGTGTVILELTVSPAGVVEDVVVKVPVSGATEAAVAAAEQWLFEPLIWNGEPAWAVTAVSVPNPCKP